MNEAIRNGGAVSIDWKKLGLREPTHRIGIEPAWMWGPLPMVTLCAHKGSWEVAHGSGYELHPALESAAAHLRRLGCGPREEA